MKKVFKSAEVAHIWAQQKQEDGHNSGNTMFFAGKSIFSYGHHFEMARFVRPGVVLITTRGYSVTTSRHLRYVKNAVSNKMTFEVPTFDDATTNALHLAKTVREQIEATSRARTRIGYSLESISSLSVRAIRYLETFKKDIKPTARKEIRDLNKYFHKVLPQERIDILKMKEAEHQRKYRLRQEEKRWQEEKRLAEDVEAWKQGVGIHLSYGFTRLPVALRIQQDRIETSHGASVPLLAARELWDRLKRREPLHGMVIGDYTVTGFDGSTLTVGCHQIPAKEILKMARALNWAEEGATI